MKQAVKWIVAVMFGAVAGMAQAQLVWTGSVNNNWDTSTLNWLNGATPVAYSDGNPVFFGDTAAQTNINIVAPVAPSSIIISNKTLTYTFTNTSISGSGSLVQSGGGVVILAVSNGFSGGLTVNGSSNNTLLVSRAAGAVGTGPILLNAGSPAGQNAILQFEVPNLVLNNSLTLTGRASSVILNSSGFLTLQGNLTGTNPLTILATNIGQPVLILNQAAAGNTVNMGNGMISHGAQGLLDPVSPANFPSNYYSGASGAIVLSPGFTWSNLVAGRTWFNTSAPNGGQWLARCFAARGTVQVIDGSGAFQSGATNNWLTTGGNAFTLGSAFTNADGSFYANAGVTIARPITLGVAALHVTVAATGPGLTNATDSGAVYELAGTINGPGSLYVSGTGSTVNDGVVPELVLSGSSVWSNGMNIGINSGFSSGPGGLAIAGAGPTGLIRFNGNASLPSGNAGANAYLFAAAYAGSYNRVNGYYGYLLTGSNGVDRVYALASGMRFVIGGTTSNSVGTSYGTLGAGKGRVVLTNSMVTVYNYDAAPQILCLLVRDTNGVMTLGSSAGPVRFSSSVSTGGSTTAVGNWGPTNAPAEPMWDRFCMNTLYKRGKGTLALSNVTYELLGGGGSLGTNFNWQLGGGIVGQDDGVVRETGTGINNSLRTQSVWMNGGVMGLVADYTAQIGTNSIQASYSAPLVNYSGPGGGGFAAYGTNCAVTLVPFGSTNRFSWGQTSLTAPDTFMNLAAPIILNARDADAAITVVAASSNAITLLTGSANYVINVQDNPATNTDMAVMAIRLTSATNLSGATFTKMGPGTLVLTATNNDYQAATMVSNGTLIVNGAILTNRVAASSNLTVCAGATLGGTGTIVRAVSVLSGGTLEAGDQYTQTGTLTLSNNLSLAAGSTLFVNASPAGASGLVNVIGTAQVSGVVTGTVTGLLSGDATLLQAVGGVNTNGMTAALPRGYVIRLGGGNTQLNLHYSSPGFVIRVQ